MQRFDAERVEDNTPDLFLIAVILVLLGLGISSLFSASFFRAETLFDNPFYFLRRQLLWIFVGLTLAFIASRISLELVKKLLPIVMLVSLVLIVLTFVPGIGARFLGARRWIFLFGYSFQPSELVKVTLVIYLAYILARKQDSLYDPVNSLLPPLITVIVFAGLIYLQNDFSTTIFLIIVALVMFFIGGVPIRYFLGLAAVTVPIGTLLLLTKVHRVERVIAFLQPERYPTGIGYQVLAARTALQNGGLWGAGIGEGQEKFGALPEAHSDFVFAVFAEETGFIGVLTVVALFGMVAYRGYVVASRVEGKFESFLAFGLSTTIVLQALLNVAVVSGAVPATGVPLPFFSSGGSSAIMTLVAAGLLLNLSRKARAPGEAG